MDRICVFSAKKQYILQYTTKNSTLRAHTGTSVFILTTNMANR